MATEADYGSTSAQTPWTPTASRPKPGNPGSMVNGKAREMRLGPLHTIGLSEARELARQARKQILQGIDPLESKHSQRKARALEAAKAITFRDCADKYIEANRAAGRNDKYTAQWGSTLTTYAYPVIGAQSVDEVDTGHVTKILQPIWIEKSETASLTKENGIAALALRFAILTAGRTTEIIEAEWNEIDFESQIWTVCAERMKASREHRVPLTEAAGKPPNGDPGSL